MTPQLSHRLRAALALAAGAAACAAAPTGAVAATSNASANVTAGTLAFGAGTPSDVTFGATTLDGTNKTTTGPQTIDVSDASGSGAGWKVSATSTTFASGGDQLATTATTLQASPGQACYGGSTCVTPTNGISYPYSLPAGGVPPTETVLYNAAANTGLGNVRLTPTWQLSLPASTKAGSYTSVWTFTLASGPN